MVNKPVISLDVDGILSNFTAGSIPIINETLGLFLPDDFEPTTWEYKDVIKGSEEWDKVWEKIKGTKNFWHRLPAYTGNARALGLFLRETRRDYDVYYLTSRPDTKGDSALQQTKLWLDERNLLKDQCSVIVVRDPKEKAGIVRGLGAIASIDDYLPTAAAHARIKGHYSCLLDRPWNRSEGDRRIAMEATMELKNAGMFAPILHFTDFLNWLLALSNQQTLLGNSMPPAFYPVPPTEQSQATHQ